VAEATVSVKATPLVLAPFVGLLEAVLARGVIFPAARVGFAVRSNRETR